MEVRYEKSRYVELICQNRAPNVVYALQKRTGRRELEGIKVQALVTGGVDYKDSDRLLTLCSVEQGKLTALLKGCRKEKSKLRFSGAPFCFCEYVLTEKNGYYTVTGATAIEQFASISQDLDRYYAGCVILETLSKSTREGENIAPYVAMTLNHLKSLCYESVDEGLVLLSFFLTLFKQAGYELSFSECKVCRSKSFMKKYFSFLHGGVVCNICSGRDAVSISIPAVNLMRSIADGISLSVLCFEKNVTREALSVCGQFFAYLTKEKLNSLTQYFDILKNG